ncbi:putative class 3 lipase [Leptomonas seymouri]|uniref:Putative class 3 lipase n=1 Tax=Leptomonas seymouri TaxID=5684 RepID=A0A0N1I7D8_LEPSE|nr:putative class 3 lipase [Leptomonas seymouri]|eukprot:KPI87201.1 putative class 3 lipase [Leptomonas seymouri]
MPSDNAARAPAPARQHVSQPQWRQFALMRDYVYTHTQPQWLDVKEEQPACAQVGCSSASAELPALCWTPTVVRPPPLEPQRACTTCLQPKQACTCKVCNVCQAAFLTNRHHCRRCWHAVCSHCWGYKHYVHMLGRPMMVCDRCSVPWVLASAAKRDGAGLLWGLYALRIAGDMPRLCVAPPCRTFTRRLTCYVCGLPTVATQPHEPRVLRPNGVSNAAMETVGVLDMQQLSMRAMEVNGMTTADVERIFRRCFHRHEEVVAFRMVTTATVAQRILLAQVAAAVAYEYVGAPNITLGMSDIPYARVLQVTLSRERYTVLEAPGRVKFIAFPGTHNWRTWWVDMQFSQVQEAIWTRLHEGLRPGPHSHSASVPLCGGVRKAWEYRVHGGFAQEARAVGLPLDPLIEDVRHGGYTLVLCGHSLGGAVAQYLSLQLLQQEPALLAPTGPLKEPKLMCVTFGSPMLGNHALATHVHSCGWSHLFHNFVYRSDLVPRLSCADELLWDAGSRLTRLLASLFSAAHGWWRGKSNQDEKSCDVKSSTGVQAPFGAVPPPACAAGAGPTPSEPPPGLHVTSSEDGGSQHNPIAAAAAAAAASKHRTIPAVLSKVVETTVALSLGVAGGVSGGMMTSGRGDGAPDVATNASAAISDADESCIAVYMDTAIRTSCDLLEEEEGGDRIAGLNEGKAMRNGTVHSCETPIQRDADVEAALGAFASRCDRLKSASLEASRVLRSHRSGADDCSDGVEDSPVEEATALHKRRSASPPLGASVDVMADVVIPNRCLHRRFTCFGRYHFLQYGRYGYVSTDDSETAFGILKHGCGERAVMADHSVAAYNRGLMIHLYRNAD